MEWCRGRESNSHAVKHWFLRPTCLPIPSPRLNTKNASPMTSSLYINGGQRGSRTPESEASGFTVRPIWPLWNLPRTIYISIKKITKYESKIRIYFKLVVRNFKNGANDRIWTDDRSLTRRMLYQLSYIGLSILRDTYY